MSDSDIVGRLRHWPNGTSIPLSCADEIAARQLMSAAADEITSLRTELAALRESVEWREIETAPKDGTRVILATISDGDVDSSSGYWTDHNGGGWVRFMPWQPTHWLPLPPIPDTPKETGE